MTEMQHSATDDAFPADIDQREIDAAESLALSAIEDDASEPRASAPMTAVGTTGLPHSYDAERSVLGGILIDNDTIEQARATLGNRYDFYSDRHRITYAALERLADAGTKSDLVTLKDELERTGELEAAGGPAYLATLVSGVPRSSNVKHYARIVQDKAHRRAIINLAVGLTGAAFNGFSSSELDDLVEGLAQLPGRFRDGVSLGVTGHALMKGDTITPAVPLIQGFIDEGNRGWLVGDSEKGKSLTAMNIAACAAGGISVAGKWPVPKPIKTAMLFLEDRPMPDGSFPPRIKWRYRGNIEGLRDAGHDEQTIELILDNLLLWCGDNYQDGLALARKHGSRLTFIDSWNILCPDDETDTRGRNKIRRIMDRIHAALGNEAYLLLDHTNQDGGKDDTRPDKSRQYGSSGKHQVADVVFMLKPSDPIFNEATGDNELAVTLKPIKARDGCNIPKSGCVLHWKGLPVDRKLPMDKPVPLALEYVRDNAETRDLGQISSGKKKAQWAKAVRAIQVTGGKRKVTEIVTELDTTKGTVYRWLKDPDSPFVALGDGLVGLKNE